MLYSENEGKAGYLILDGDRRKEQKRHLPYIRSILACTFSDSRHVKRNTMLQIFIVTVTFILLIRVFPMGVVQSHTYSKQAAFERSKREELVGDAFTAKDKKLQTVYFQETHLYQITLYINCQNEGEGTLLFRLYNENYSCIYEQEVSSSKIKAKGYIQAVPDLDVEVGKAYYYEVIVPEDTSAQFELPVADRGALAQLENSILYIDGIINDEICLIADFDYSRPLSIVAIVLYDLFIIGGSLIVYILVSLIVVWYDRQTGKTWLLSGKLFRIMISALIGIGAIILLVFSVALNQFGGEIWDRMFFLIGILAGVMWLLAAIWIPVWYPRPDKPLKITVAKKRALIWRNYIQTVSFGLLFYALCQYVNADRNYYHYTNTRWMLIFLAIAFLMNYTKKQFWNILSIVWLVLGGIGSIIYCVQIDRTDEQAFMLARLTCGVIVAWGWLIVTILVTIIKKRGSLRENITSLKRNPIKVVQIVLLIVLIIFMYVYRYEKVWVFTATLPFVALLFSRSSDAANNRFLRNFANGILLSFGFVTIFCLAHRPHHYWMLYRYGGIFHTVASTGMYLAVVLGAAMAVLYGKLKKQKRMFARCWFEYLVTACTVGFILLTMSKTALLTTVVTVVSIMILTAVVYHKNIQRLLAEAGLLAVVCAVSFPMVFTAVRMMPALVRDPVRYDVEFQDSSFMIDAGDPIDSDKYMTVRRFFLAFFGRFQTDQEAVLEDTKQQEVLLAYTGAGFAGANQKRAVNEEDNSEEKSSSSDISNGRFDIFGDYIREIGFKGHPKMGPKRANGEDYAHAHNSYLQVAYNFGMMAGGIFFILTVLALWKAVVLFYRQGSRIGTFLVPFALIMVFGFVSLTEWAFHPCIPAGFCFILMQVFLLKR